MFVSRLRINAQPDEVSGIRNVSFHHQDSLPAGLLNSIPEEAIGSDERIPICGLMRYNHLSSKGRNAAPG